MRHAPCSVHITLFFSGAALRCFAAVALRAVELLARYIQSHELLVSFASTPVGMSRHATLMLLPRRRLLDTLFHMLSILMLLAADARDTSLPLTLRRIEQRGMRNRC